LADGYRVTHAGRTAVRPYQSVIVLPPDLGLPPIEL